MLNGLWEIESVGKQRRHRDLNAWYESLICHLIHSRHFKTDGRAQQVDNLFSIIISKAKWIINWNRNSSCPTEMNNRAVFHDFSYYFDLKAARWWRRRRRRSNGLFTISIAEQSIVQWIPQEGTHSEPKLQTNHKCLSWWLHNKIRSFPAQFGLSLINNNFDKTIYDRSPW